MTFFNSDAPQGVGMDPVQLPVPAGFGADGGTLTPLDGGSSPASPQEDPALDIPPVRESSAETGEAPPAAPVKAEEAPAEDAEKPGRRRTARKKNEDAPENQPEKSAGSDGQGEDMGVQAMDAPFTLGESPALAVEAHVQSEAYSGAAERQPLQTNEGGEAVDGGAMDNAGPTPRKRTRRRTKKTEKESAGTQGEKAGAAPRGGRKQETAENSVKDEKKAGKKTTGKSGTAKPAAKKGRAAGGAKSTGAKGKKAAAKTRKGGAKNGKADIEVKALADKPTLSLLELKELDRDLTELEREEWNEVYASYRSQSLMTGRIIGVDPYYFMVKNLETGRTERKLLYTAVVERQCVKIMIPDTELWTPGNERPSHVTKNLSGAEIDFVITDVDRKGGVAMASRRIGTALRRHLFDTIKGGHKPGERLKCRILSVGPKRCLIEVAGRDITLTLTDISYTAIPDLRKKYRPGMTDECILMEWSRKENHMKVSIKEAQPHPFDSAVKKHVPGSRRRAVISGKYGGGVFCTLPDDTVCLCHYSVTHSDRDFRIGDTVILVILKHDYARRQIQGRILSKW